MSTPKKKPIDPLTVVERSYVVAEVAAAVRHDLHNKLATIRNAVYYMKRKIQPTDVWKQDPRLEAFFKIIEDECGAAQDLIVERLGLLSPDQSDAVRVNASVCVRQAVAAARIASHSRVEISVDGGDAEIEVQPDELALAIRCLIENAAESMTEGGTVTVRSLVDADQCQIEVADSGPGIRDFEQVLFPFHTTKTDRLGLGLNMCRRVVQRHQGRLDLLPDGDGNRVRISLPLATRTGA